MKANQKEKLFENEKKVKKNNLGQDLGINLEYLLNPESLEPKSSLHCRLQLQSTYKYFKLAITLTACSQ